MGLTYREDDDLAFLKRCDNQDLELLFNYLTRNDDGEERFTGTLLSEPDVKRMLSLAKPDYRKVWQPIAAELQLFGGNTVVNWVRRNGVAYKEVLSDVCNRLKVSFNSQADVFEIESAMLQHVLKQSWEHLSDEDRRKILEESGLDVTSIDGKSLQNLLKNIGAIGGGAAVFSRYLAQAFAMRFGGVVGGGVLGGAAMVPLVNIVGAIWGITLVAGPAYRVTVPCVFQIAYMRLKAVTEVCV